MIRRHSAEQDTLGCIEDEDIKRIPAHVFVPNGFIQGSNMAFRRSCLDAAGEFDERRKALSGETFVTVRREKSANGKMRVLGLEPKTYGLKVRCSTN